MHQCVFITNTGPVFESSLSTPLAHTLTIPLVPDSLKENRVPHFLKIARYNYLLVFLSTHGAQKFLSHELGWNLCFSPFYMCNLKQAVECI